jgi:hypothetical protein
MTQDAKCFACDRPFRSPRRPLAITSDGQRVFVGPECHRRIVQAGAAGYQPPLSGPRLFALEHGPRS